jgi:ATP/ADP translocase
VFNTYRFDHPETDESQTLDARSYLWASLFGPLYVLRLGFPILALLILPISATITVVAFFGFGLVDWALGSELITVGALLAMPVAALAAQGFIVIELLRRAYLRAGWLEGY